MFNPRPITCCTLILAGLTAGAAAEPLDAVIDKLHGQVSGYKSLQYKMHVRSEMKQEGFSSNSTQDISAAFMKKDDKYLSRLESDTTSVNVVAGNEQKMDVKSLIIFDGEFQWTLNDMMGMKQATKQKADSAREAANPLSPKTHFQSQKKSFDLKVLDDESVDGKTCHVIEMTPKDPETKAMIGRTVTYFDKKTGINIKSVSYNPSGDVVSTVKITDIKINDNIDPDKFKFTPPAGVQVNDMTRN